MYITDVSFAQRNLSRSRDIHWMSGARSGHGRGHHDSLQDRITFTNQAKNLSFLTLCFDRGYLPFSESVQYVRIVVGNKIKYCTVKMADDERTAKQKRIVRPILIALGALVVLMIVGLVVVPKIYNANLRRKKRQTLAQLHEDRAALASAGRKYTIHCRPYCKERMG